MKAWLNGELVLLYKSYYEMLLSGMVNLLGGSVYLLYLVYIESTDLKD